MVRGRTNKDRIISTHSIPSRNFLVTHTTRHRIRHLQVPALPPPAVVQATEQSECGDDWGSGCDFEGDSPLPNSEDDSPVAVKIKIKWKKCYLNSVRCMRVARYPYSSSYRRCTGCALIDVAGPIS